jgi:DNA-binding PadR family transcriptional regulator
MLIEDAILGLVSCAPMSGYDLKKTLSRSPLFEWSGGSNQVYKALSALAQDGYVESELIPGVGAPAKKSYRATSAGLVHLRNAVLELPEPPAVRRPFALQLLFAHGVSAADLAVQLDAYEGEVQGMLAAFGANVLPGVLEISAYQRAILDACAASLVAFYERELTWIDHLRTTALPLASSFSVPAWKQNLVCEIREAAGMHYVVAAHGQVCKESDGLTLVNACVENDINLVLLPAASLSDEFRKLSTKVAGQVVGKLANYRIRTAAVLDPDTAEGALADFIVEANRSDQFHASASEEEAIAWLVGVSGGRIK